MRLLLLPLLLLAWFSLPLSALTPAFQDPVADPRAVVYAGNARFTVLTAHIIRMEWSPTLRFQDRATWAITFRRQPVPPYKVSHNGSHTVIATQALTLTYLTNSSRSFNHDNLLVTTALSSWHADNHEDLLSGRLPGTVRTLDGTNGQADIQLDCQYNSRSDLHCTYGVISRGGIAVIDDTNAPSFDNASWPWIVASRYDRPQQCTVDDAVKRDCASYPTIDQGTCEAQGCCWSSSPSPSSSSSSSAVPGIPFCYYAADGQQDLYLLAHGHDYKLAMREFTTIAGRIPLPPRYAFGLFFSRWWAYASYEERELVSLYATHDVPLDTIVTDMDWHLTFYKEANNGVVDQAGQSKGWTGFTFNRLLFDQPALYLAWCKRYGLHNSMNLHPASGIQLWEESYEAMADAMGQTNHSRYIPFNVTDRRFVTNWFNLTLGPLETAGIDLWWLDWQQGEDWLSVPHANPTYWLNYLFFTGPRWELSGARPALLHRWGGLGNHRYQIGFSGDVETSYESLTFQPYFTASASNVGFSFWSHDLGSFGGLPSPELFVRWLQWGAFSPIWRCHAGKDRNNVRFPWQFEWAEYRTLRALFKLRQALLPYIYTAARRTHETGLGLVLPLYYDWPELDAAYNNTHSYLYGDALYVSPITAPVNGSTGLVSHQFWLPPGQWVNIFTGHLHSGPADYRLQYTLTEMPAYVRAGSIVPMLPDSAPPIGQAKLVPTALRLMTFIGEAQAGTGRLYDDAGDSQDYLKPAGSHSFAFTEFNYRMNGTRLAFHISAADDSFTTLPASRTWEIHLRGIVPAETVIASGRPLPFMSFDSLPVSFAKGATQQDDFWTYDGNTLTVIVYLNRPIPVRNATSLLLTLDGSVGLESPDGYIAVLQRWIAAKIELDNEWGSDHTVYMDDYPTLLRLAQIGDVVTNKPSQVRALIGSQQWRELVDGACKEINGGITNLRPSLMAQLDAQLCHGWE